MEQRRAAVILAGGRSSRMGRPKAWLELGGETLLHRIARIVAAACPIVVVVAAADQPLPSLPKGIVRVDDAPEHAGLGPLAGVLTGLLALRDTADLIYVGASDAAWLTTRHVQHVLDVLEHSESSAVVPQSASRDGHRIVHGTSGALRLPIACSTAQASVHAGERALRSLYERLDALRIESDALPDPAAVRACNDPSDWEAAMQTIAGTG